MKMAPGTPLSISLAFDPLRPHLPVGRVAIDAGLAQLEWSREVVAGKLTVGGLLYPPEVGLQAARGRAFEGLHGFLADSLPEGWGYLLMRKHLAKLGIDIASLTPLERLALIGGRGRGALVFEPATLPPEDVESLDLDVLAEQATTLLRGEEVRLADTLADLAGGSGGARPKVHVGFNEQGDVSVGEGEMAVGFTPWLVKFRSPQDPIDIGPIEEAYGNMAEAAGLTLSAHRLIEAREGPGYFATQRFDRIEGAGRLHMVSLAGAIEAPSTVPSTSYDMFLRATRAITRQADDVAAAFRRMVFNILASNRDDHTRQHAYLMDATGDWRLSPAYDLTYSPGPGGEHYMDIAGEGRRPTRDHVAKLGEQHGYSARYVAVVIDEVRTAVAGWTKFAKRADVTTASTTPIGQAHDKIWIDFEPK